MTLVVIWQLKLDTHVIVPQLCSKKAHRELIAIKNLGIDVVAQNEFQVKMISKLACFMSMVI